MKWVLRFLPLLLVVMLFGSCDRNSSSNPGSSGSTNGTPTTISIAPISAIRNFRNSNVTTTVTATVTDARGSAVPYAHVAFGITKRPTTAASISYVAGDSTDVNGNVSATLSVTLDTTETITVNAHLIANSQIFTNAACPVVLLSDQIQSFSLTYASAKSVLVYRPGGRDSTQMIATVQDDQGGGISGLTIDFQIIHTDTSSGTPFVTLSATTGTTDVNGELRIYIWNNPSANLNRLVSDSISASIRGMLQTSLHRTAGALIHVQPLTAPADIFLRWVNPSDTLISSEPGIVVERQFVVWCQDSAHVRLPNIPILLRSEGIGSIPYITSISSAGLDTISWSSDGTSPGRVTITASVVQTQFAKVGSGNGPVKVLGPTAKLDNSVPTALNFEHNLKALAHPRLLGLDQVDENNSLTTSITLAVTAPSSITRLTTQFRRIPPLMYSTGQDSLEVNVVLRDQNNSGVPNALLTFSTAHGLIPATATTDISGSVRAYLTDGGDTTAASGELLYVRYPAMNLTDSARFWIRPKLDLDHMSINGPSSHVAYPGDTVSFTATIFLTNGNYCYDSTRVYWNCYKSGVPEGAVAQNGIGQFQYPLTRTGSGSTTNTFYMRNGTGRDSLVVMAFTEGRADTIRHWWYFDHVPGVAVHLFLSPRNVGLEVNAPVLTPNITAIVTDTAGNLVPNSPINFGCDNGVGTIVRGGTSGNGDTTYAILSAGSQAGTFHYWATTVNGATDTASFTVSASTPRTLTLSSDSQILQVRGTGGNENTTLHAIVRDGNGNPVANGTYVTYVITNEVMFDDSTGLITTRPYFAQPGFDSAISVTSGTGEALAVLSSGTKSGAVQITAYISDAQGNPTAANIHATLSSVQIVSGPPASITVSYNAGSANQEGGGTWSIWVNATVRDQYSNPVANRYSVTFAVTPISLAQVGLDTAATGNTGPSNQHLPGVAFTRLSYQGQNSFDTVTVTASAIGRDVNQQPVLITAPYRFALPLQQGSLQLNVSPNTFLFSRPPTSSVDVDVATHMVWAKVTDGYGLDIHGCPILFSVQRGKWYRTASEAANRAYSPANSYRQSDNSQSFPGTSPAIYWPVNKRKTGNYTVPAQPLTSWTDPNGNGAATLYIGALGPSFGWPGANGPVGEVFLDPQTAETTSEVTAIVEGYPNIQSVRVVINYQRS